MKHGTLGEILDYQRRFAKEFLCNVTPHHLLCHFCEGTQLLQESAGRSMSSLIGQRNGIEQEDDVHSGEVIQFIPTLVKVITRLEGLLVLLLSGKISHKRYFNTSWLPPSHTAPASPVHAHKLSHVNPKQISEPNHNLTGSYLSA